MWLPVIARGSLTLSRRRADPLSSPVTILLRSLSLCLWSCMAWDLYRLLCPIIKSLIDLRETWINNARGAHRHRQTQNRKRTQFLRSSIVALWMKRHCLTGRKASWCWRAPQTRGTRRRKREEACEDPFSEVWDWWQTPDDKCSSLTSRIDAWLHGARVCCHGDRGSTHLPGDQYSSSPNPMSVINLNIKHVSCHTAREQYYPMKRALMNRRKRTWWQGAAGKRVSPATCRVCRKLFFSPLLLPVCCG